MKIYFFASQIPELQGLNSKERRAVAKEASFLQWSDNPLFTPSLVWLFAASVSGMCSFTPSTAKFLEHDMSLKSSVLVAGLFMLLPIVVTGFAFGQVLTIRMRPFYAQARKKIVEVQPV